MRTIVVALFLLLFFVISIPLYVIELIVGRFNPRLQAASSQAIVKGALKVVLFFSGVKVKVSGVEKVPKDQAVLYVSNHRGIYDILLAYTTVPTLTGFVSKKEIQRIPFIRTWMKFLNCLFLDRENIKEGLKTILQGIEKIKDGYSIFIMPEGTRHTGEGVLPFHEGSFKFAEKTGCPVIPVAITKTDDIFENHIPWIKRTHAAIRYGEPILVGKLTKEERKFLGSHSKKIIETMLEEIS